MRPGTAPDPPRRTLRLVPMYAVGRPDQEAGWPADRRAHLRRVAGPAKLPLWGPELWVAPGRGHCGTPHHELAVRDRLRGRKTLAKGDPSDSGEAGYRHPSGTRH